MKPSHITTPRTMNDACWHSSGEAFHHWPQERDNAYAVILATLIGIVAALLLVHWWAS